MMVLRLGQQRLLFASKCVCVGVDPAHCALTRAQGRLGILWARVHAWCRARFHLFRCAVPHLIVVSCFGTRICSRHSSALHVPPARGLLLCDRCSDDPHFGDDGVGSERTRRCGTMAHRRWVAGDAGHTVVGTRLRISFRVRHDGCVMFETMPSLCLAQCRFLPHSLHTSRLFFQ